MDSENAKVLTCSHCEKPCGARVHTRLDTSECSEGSTVTNKAGRLACKPPDGTPDANGLPAGTYLNSCDGCSIAGETLSCSSCTDSKGKLAAASLVLTGCDLATIGNEDGLLVCVRPPQDDEASPPATEAPSGAPEAATLKTAIDDLEKQRPTDQPGHDEL